MGKKNAKSKELNNILANYQYTNIHTKSQINSTHKKASSKFTRGFH